MIISKYIFYHFLVFFILMCDTPEASGNGAPRKIMCIEKEKQALLRFKKEITNNDHQLTSWGTEESDCCKWKGVYCHNRTGNVVELNLRAYREAQVLTGEISPSLLQLRNLEYLDLSNNAFGRGIPSFFGLFTRLKYLNLSDALFYGTIPHELRNLSSLHTLDLASNVLFSDNLEWLLPLQSLRNLYLQEVDLSKANDWLNTLNNLPQLRVLRLSECQLPRVTPSLLNSVNFSKYLSVVDVSFNDLDSSVYTWLFNYSSSLSNINLSNINLQGLIPDDLANAVHLMHLDLSYNKLEGGIPSYLGNFSSLKSLLLSGNSFEGHMPELMKNLLGGRVSSTLEYLNLDENRISGPLPDTLAKFSFLEELRLRSNNLNGSMSKACGELSNLRVLDLKENKISGFVPDFSLSSSLTELNLGKNQLTGVLTDSIGHLSNLEKLYLGSNCLEGVISESHMLNLSRLQFLDLSLNSDLEIRFHPDWIPPFQLVALNFARCKIGPHFPRWLRTQKSLRIINLSATRISGDIPSWFWNHLSGLKALNLSHNLMDGTLPDLYTKVHSVSLVDLSSNNFEGPIPRLPESLVGVYLLKNRFSGNIASLCNPSAILECLDFSDNQLSGELPDCLGQVSSLCYFNVANNNFFGKLPNSIGSSSSIQVLQLRNNSFTGELPRSWQDFTALQFIDLGENSLFGAIPAWVGSNLSGVVVLSLSSNNFSGSIPREICNLSQLQILDLSGNKISGTIPKCIGNFSAMNLEGNSGFVYMSSNFDFKELEISTSYIQEAFLIWKRSKSRLKSNLVSVKFIDLSSNNLVGIIPLEVTGLIGLVGLNLSRNNLSGILTPQIDQLNSLNFLDLSINQLSGEIPSALSQLSFLGVLDLSYNNFTGRIPSSTHLQTFDNSSFVGNPGLCGVPLSQACPGDDELPQHPKFVDEEEQENQYITKGFYLSLVLGFVVGFWGICGTIFFNRSCRHLFYRGLDEMNDWFYAITILKLARLQRRLQG